MIIQVLHLKKVMALTELVEVVQEVWNSLEWYGSVGISGLPADLGISYYLVTRQQVLQIIMIILITNKC